MYVEFLPIAHSAVWLNSATRSFYAAAGVALLAVTPFTSIFFFYAGLALSPKRRAWMRLVAFGLLGLPIAFGSGLISFLVPPAHRADQFALACALLLGTTPIAIVWGRRRRASIRREAIDEGRELPSSGRRFDRDLVREVERAAQWLGAFRAASTAELSRNGWLGHRFVADWESQRPVGLDALIGRRRFKSAIGRLPPTAETTIRDWRRGPAAIAEATNEAHVQERLQTDRRFFQTVERSPLTDEQARAVLCFDDRVRVIASAGSGKTSTIVAKAAYAISRELTSIDRVLVLTFNNSTATELQQRIAARFAALGLPPGVVKAQTFHAFGLALAGTATGRKPSLARWIDQRGEADVLADIVGRLRAEDATFDRAWKIYRTFYADPSSWDEEDAAKDRYATLSGISVRSHGEQVIADFLWTNGVAFEYEKDYSFDIADAGHAQYRPDFYYPAVDVWHEHWALDADDAAPSEFDGYAEGVAWKRATHRANGTALIETRWGDLGSADFLRDLADQLRRCGIELHERFDRPSGGRVLPSDRDLLKQVLDFNRLAKSDGRGRDDLTDRAERLRTSGLRRRASLFVELATRIQAEWDARLAAEQVVDYEDMLLTAAELLESGEAQVPFDLILVDEFQDTSPARARILRALLAEPGRRLFAVGDDWQAINRFAGADLGVLTDFEAWFGPASTVRLETTFRSSQPICDIAGAFVAKNPRQLTKQVRSDVEPVSPAVEAWLVDREDSQSAAIARFLDELQSRMTALRRRGDDVRRRSVRLLGRYDWLKSHVPTHSCRWPDLEVSYSTIHAAKGLEADYVVVLSVTSGRYGFPSTQRTDPNLELVLPPEDEFLDGEERRLLYVALTRARRRVVLLTVNGSVSPFIRELVHSDGVALVGADGDAIRLCPRCGQGRLREKAAGRRAIRVCDRGRCDYSEALDFSTTGAPARTPHSVAPVS